MRFLAVAVTAICLLHLEATGANALQCYRTVFAQSQGQDAGSHQEMACKENSVCMLAEVHLEIEYTPVTVYVGFCFLASEVNTTACEDVLANMGQINAVGPGNKHLQSCRLSFCNDDLCNDKDGPTLPQHFPSATAVGDPVECYAIHKTTTSLGSGNTNQVTRITCRAGASCFLSKAQARARSTYRNFDVGATTGGCKLASFCAYDDCDWVQSDIEGMIPSSIQVDITVKSCQAACCNGSLCNDANADIFSSANGGDADGSDLSVPIIAAIACIALGIIVVAAIVVFACKRSRNVPFTPGTADPSIKT